MVKSFGDVFPTLKLNNLTVIVDHNKLQAMDRLENIVNMTPFADKWRAFGWHVIEINGSSVSDVLNNKYYKDENGNEYWDGQLITSTVDDTGEGQKLLDEINDLLRRF